MSTSAIKVEMPTVEDVKVSGDALTVDLSDGRTISVPLGWYPRLIQGTAAERTNWRKIGQGVGIHWEDLDEDVSVEGLIAGRCSVESQESFRRWLEKRKAA